MWLQFEQYAIPKAQAAAIHDRVDEDAVLAGLVRLWGWAQRERKTQVTATELRGFFRVDCIEGLLAFDFLEPLKDKDLFRVRGTSRYVLDFEARSKGGKATAAKNLMRGRQRPGSAPAGVPAAAGEQPESSGAGSRLRAGRGPGRREKRDQDKDLPPPSSSFAANGTERQVTRSARRGGRGQKSNGATATEAPADSPEADVEPHGAEALEAWAALVHRASQLDVALAPRPPRAFAAWWADAKGLELGRLVGAFARFVLDVRAGSLGKRAGPSFELFARPAVWRQRLPPPEPEPEPVLACARCELIVPAERGFSPLISGSGDPICWDCCYEMQAPSAESAH